MFISTNNIILAGDVNCIKDPDIDYNGPATSFTVPTAGSELLDRLCIELKLTDIYRARYPTRPNFTCISRQTYSRLDRIYISTSLYNRVKYVSITAVAFSDHLSLSTNIVST